MNVAFLIYRRPELTRRVFEAIRAAQPERLLVVADGPRNEAEVSRCTAAREIVNGVDWPCEVLRNYADRNLGCRERVSSGISWVFGAVDEAIILEDDCLPHPDFFSFCQEMLARYRDDVRIAHINGSNLDRRSSIETNRYYFSRYPSVWGWATWRRAWEKFDHDMSLWPELRKSAWLREVCSSAGEARYFQTLFDGVMDRRIDSWATIWTLTCFHYGLLSIRPPVNLVSNIGFSESDGNTHTTFTHWAGNLPTNELLFPLVHPVQVVADKRLDARLSRAFYRRVSVLERVMSATLLNRYWYGGWLRRIPLVGRLWAFTRRSGKGLE